MAQKLKELTGSGVATIRKSGEKSWGLRGWAGESLSIYLHALHCRGGKPSPLNLTATKRSRLVWPAHPAERPLAWRERGDAFDRYVMDPANKILPTRADGSRYFASALEGTGDGGMTMFGPLVLGKILRGDTVDSLVPSMAAYFSDEAGRITVRAPVKWRCRNGGSGTVSLG